MSTSFSVSSQGDPFDQLLAQVREAATGAYDVIGEIGRSKRGNVVYLARDLETGLLVAMKLSRGGGASGDEFNLEVVRTLETTVPGLESKCPECQSILPDWDRFCFRCGADLATTGFQPGGADEDAKLLAAVREATAGEYEIIGKMDRADGGGPVFFAKELKRNKLVALRLKREDTGDPNQPSYSIGESQAFRPLVADLGATVVAPAGFNYNEPAAAPPPPPPAPVVVPPRVEPPPRYSVPVAAPVEPAPVPRPPVARRAPFKLIAGGASAIALLVILFLVFRGGDEVPTPALPATPPPAPSTPEPAPAPTPPSEPAPEPAPPPSAAADVDSATILVGVPLPTGGRLTLNGRPVRGARIRVRPGSFTLALTAPGHESAQERVTVTAGQTFTWRPALTPIVAAQPAPPPAQPPAATSTCARAAGRSEWPVALDLCKKEAAAGEVASQRLLAKMFDAGTGTPQDRAQAAQWYTRAAGGGDREAQERLGYLYREGLGVKKDEKQSASFFKQAAEGGRPAAELEYGVALEEGRGVNENDKEAAQWYERAAAAGNSFAARRLARLYERGNGVAKNESEAAKWYRAAADRGDREAQYSLGRAYKDGKGVPKSSTDALEWFKKAAAQGHREAAEEAKKLEKS